jgi:DNA-binding transcriptional LysR family regulator
VTKLGQVDLNLLLPLAALLDERHVSRAAERAGLSQPAMSRALGRLRATLGDELLVRAGGGYELTPRGERFQRDLAVLLPRLRELVADAPFSPEEAAETFRVAGTDYAAYVIVPALVRRFFAASPHSQLRLGGWHPELFDDLDRGRTHLLFRVAAPPGSLRSEELFTDRFVCVVAADHPLAAAPRVTLRDYLHHRHIQVSYAGQAGVDAPLAGGRRTIGLSVPYFGAALAAVAETGLVATLPQRLVAAQPLAEDRVRVVPAPSEFEPLQFRMVWHPRLDDDPAQQWLRELVRLVAHDHDDPPSA